MKTEGEWVKLFAEQESSDLAEDIFCEQKEVSHWKFCQMRRDLIKRGLLKSKKPEKMDAASFLEVQISEARQRRLPPMIEVQLPHGIILRIPADVAV